LTEGDRYPGTVIPLETRNDYLATVEEAKQEGFNRVKQYAHDLVGIFKEVCKKGDPDQVEKIGNETLVRPLIEKATP